MARPRPGTPKIIKIFCGLIGGQEAMAMATQALVGHFGRIDCESASMDFDFTDYYAAEMGRGLKRRWISFQTLRERAYLPIAKHLAAGLEIGFAAGGKRTVNIDPGYIDDAQVVLSTAKNYSHRVYIGMAYYAEVTLIYEHGAFKPLEWTYPDYKVPASLAFFGKAREAYVSQVRADRGDR